jgi:ATP adenylyltransferase
LDRHDFGAAYDVLCDLPVTPARPGPGWAVIFNGGVLAGSSVGWKHLQVLPREAGAGVAGPGEAKGKGKGLLDVLSERLRGEDEGVIVHILGVPFKHAACRVPADLAASPACVVEGNGADPSAPGVRLEALYQRLRANLGYVEGPHNVLLTDDVLLVIPRRKAWMKEEGIAANAAGMVGMVWCWSDDQFDTFVRIGPMKVLEEFGVPWDEAESGKEGAGSGVV